MLITTKTIGQIENGVYPFEKAVSGLDTVNGVFGSVSDGVFSVAADATKAIAQVENGDEAGLDDYRIFKDQDVRVIDFTKLEGQEMRFFGELPSGTVVGSKLKSDATGKLVTGASAAPYYEVTEIIGNKEGAVVKVVTTVATVSAPDGD